MAALLRPFPFRVLLLGVALFFAVSLALSWLQAVELQTGTWDQGLYQQALWSTAHGRPFYETADVETGGYGSLLQVHSVFLFYLLVPLYGLFPYEQTLFAVQSAVVAVAAVPLYFLARDLTKSARLGLVTGAMFLAWTPVLSSTLFDFHPEAFLPVELFTLVLLWERGRYRSGLAVAVLAFSTMELAPLLTLFVGIFGLLTVSPTPASRPGAERVDGPLRSFAVTLKGWLRRPRVRASLGLIVLSVGAYQLLLYLRVDLLEAILGTYPLPVSPSGYVIGDTPAALGLSWSSLSAGLPGKVTYWLLLLALLAFVPLLAPRALVLSVPWVIFSLFSGNLSYVTMGYQYGFIAASSLLVAFAYGLPLARRMATPRSAQSRATATLRPSLGTRSALSRRRTTAVLVGFVALLTVNLALTPLNPALQGSSELGGAYRVSYTPAPGFSEVESLVGLIPPQAVVLSSDDLFPLVANDENAYSLSYVPDPTLALPFNSSDPPAYVLLSQATTGNLPLWLTEILYDSAKFGVRGVVWSSPPGVVLLFEVGYSGSPTEFGTPASVAPAYFGGMIVSHPAGTVTTVPGSAYPTVVQSVSGEAGPVWDGPNVALAPGTFSVQLSLRAELLAGMPTPDPATPVAWVGAIAFGDPTLYAANLLFGDLDSANWVTITFNVTVGSPMIDFAVAGVLADDSVQVTLNYVEITPEGPR